MDSNLRFADRSAPIFETASPVSHDGLTISRPGTESSNPFPSSEESATKFLRRSAYLSDCYYAANPSRKWSSEKSGFGGPTRHNNRGTWRGSPASARTADAPSLQARAAPSCADQSGQPGVVRLVASGVCLAELLAFSTKRIGIQIHLAQRSGQHELARIRSTACAVPRPRRRVPRGCRGRRAP